MRVHLMNQYRMIVDLEEYGQSEKVFRTKSTLEQLKKELEGTMHDVEAEWVYDGVVPVAYAKVAASLGNLSRVAEFNEKGWHCDFGETNYFTKDELLKSDLAIVEGYGFIEDTKHFNNAFEVALQNL